MSNDPEISLACQSCYLEIPLDTVMKQAQWCRFPEKWVRWSCHKCGSENCSIFDHGRIEEGYLYGLVAPVLVRTREWEHPRFYVKYSRDGVDVRLKQQTWFVINHARIDQRSQ